jgi:uncharacterized protein
MSFSVSESGCIGAEPSATTNTTTLSMTNSMPQAKHALQMASSVLVPQALSCRERCGACCIAPSISSAIPGMPNGKPAGVPCVQLDAQLRCQLFGKPERPAVCQSLQPSMGMCGASADEAMLILTELELETAP